MLEFTCPSCSKRVQGDDSFAGKNVVCPNCGTSVATPKTIEFANGVTNSLPAYSDVSGARVPPDGLPTTSTKTSPTSIVVTLLSGIVFGLICVTVLLVMVPGVERNTRYANRTQSTNNLKQIGLAMQSFHDTHKRVPFNGTKAAVGGDEKSGTWAFQILPFVECQALFDNPNRLDLNAVVFLCPERGRESRCTTGPRSDYCINPWLNDPNHGIVNAPDRSLNLLGITDGTSNTIFAGHGMIALNMYRSSKPFLQSTDIYRGGDPALARQSTDNQRDTGGQEDLLRWGSPFGEGTLFVFCDGTVRMIPYSITGGVIRDGKVIRANADHEGMARNLASLLTPNGREPVSVPD